MWEINAFYYYYLFIYHSHSLTLVLCLLSRHQLTKRITSPLSLCDNPRNMYAVVYKTGTRTISLLVVCVSWSCFISTEWCVRYLVLCYAWKLAFMLLFGVKTTMRWHCIGAVWSLPVKIRAQKLAALPTPFNNVRSSQSTTFSVNSVTTTTTPSTSTSLKWTPMKTSSEQAQSAAAGISVLKQDTLDSSSSLPHVKPSSTISKHDSHMNAMDISDIENSLTDVSRLFYY